jgi:hypothetical protein
MCPTERRSGSGWTNNFDRGETSVDGPSWTVCRLLRLYPASRNSMYSGGTVSVSQTSLADK